MGNLCDEGKRIIAPLLHRYKNLFIMSFMEICKILKDHKVFKRIGIAISVGTVIHTILVWFNLIPGYEFKKVLSTSVQPQIYLFPAQKVRLGLTFADKAQTDQVQWAKWSLKKNKVDRFTAEDLHPTVIIPESEGGIYQLEVKLKLTEEDRERFGSTNVYVVQDEPIKGTTAGKTTVKASQTGLSSKFIESAKSQGLEVYQGNGIWKEMAHLVVSAAGIEVPANTELPAFTSGAVLVRAKGNQKNLMNYGTFPVPADYNNSTSQQKPANLDNDTKQQP